MAAFCKLALVAVREEFVWSRLDSMAVRVVLCLLLLSESSGGAGVFTDDL